jgi:hypothetical protein
MSTQSIPHVTARFRIGPRTVLSAVGLIVAIAATIIILALTANHTTAATPATAPHAAITVSTAQTHYLGPRQEHATPNPQTSGTTANPAAHYNCLQTAQRCIR